MPQPRKRLVSLDETPYYHCISRCVRRAFLCGKDPVTNFDFEHRRQWIVDRIKLLSSHFAIDVCAYAVMSNHYHIVVRVNLKQANHWSDHEVAARWTKLFAKPTLIRRFLKDMTLTAVEQRQVAELISIWRHRLSDLSWYMRCLNEPIARMANREDDCTGRFWEGRFKSQALLGERAVLACMAYVDLNPIRAALAKTPEQSAYSSIQERILRPNDKFLRPFVEHAEDEVGIPYGFHDYLELVDWAGRSINDGKKALIPDYTPPILSRFGMSSEPMLNYLRRTEKQPFTALGSVSRLRSFAHAVGRRFVKGLQQGKSLCPEVGQGFSGNT
jgi:REP element-mobilizing transposase RayT